MILYLTIGHDVEHEMPQSAWVGYIGEVDEALDNEGVVVHARFFTAPTDRAQYACWCIELSDWDLQLLIPTLRNIRQNYGQPSIRLDAVSTTVNV